MTPAQPHGLGRSERFSPSREPFRGHDDLQLVESTTSGPFKWLHPTRAHFQHVGKENCGANIGNIEHEVTPPRGEQTADSIEFRWKSRDNRKGRHTLAIQPANVSTANYMVPASTSSIKEILKNVGRMFTQYPFWDVSWLVAYIFVLGSVVWVFNAFFVWLPLQKPSTEFNNEILVGGGVTAFIGATIFEIGSVFLMLEAINEDHTGCFGWAVEEAVLDNAPQSKRGWRVRPDIHNCRHHHRNRHNLVGKGSESDPKKSADSKGNGAYDGDVSDANIDKTGETERKWSWYPSWDELTGHYVHELGFLACSFQMAGATVFWISGFTALPGIINKLSPGLEDGIYWTPQVIGGSGFIISGLLFMLETQKRWYLPALDTLGWHIGVWNFIGGLGFTLCPAFGYDTMSWAVYQASLSTFWASWAFLIGSTIQLYESLQKYPVEVTKSKKGDSAA